MKTPAMRVSGIVSSCEPAPFSPPVLRICAVVTATVPNGGNRRSTSADFADNASLKLSARAFCYMIFASKYTRNKEYTMTVADLIRAQVDALPEAMQREALDFLLFLRMKAAHAGHVSGADAEMLRYFGAAPDFPDRIADQPEQEPARW